MLKIKRYDHTQKLVWDNFWKIVKMQLFCSRETLWITIKVDLMIFP